MILVTTLMQNNTIKKPMAIKYRIQELSKGRFYPQAKLSIFHKWGYIKVYKYETPDLFKNPNGKCESIEECNEAIQKFKQYITELKQYPKYYEATNE